MNAAARHASLEALHQEVLACRRCQVAGFIPLAAPVVAGDASARVMLIGQAPGQREVERRVPFMGRAGRILFAWMERVGFRSEAECRRLLYLTAITKCYPGRGPASSGDRRPSRAEMELCRPYLDRQLALIEPTLIILVGGLAIDRFLPNRRLEQVVGRAFDLHGFPLRAGLAPGAGPVLVPLPHPSGASRWMNDPGHRTLLERALRLLRGRLRSYLAERRKNLPGGVFGAGLNKGGAAPRS